MILLSSPLEDLFDLQMQALGLQLIMSNTGSTTATGDTLDEAKTTGRLRSWADSLADAMKISIQWMFDLGGITGDASVFVNREFEALSHLTMDQVANMYTAGVISKETYINEAKRRGVLDTGIMAEDEAERVELEDGTFIDRPGAGGVDDAI